MITTDVCRRCKGYYLGKCSYCAESKGRKELKKRKKDNEIDIFEIEGQIFHWNARGELEGLGEHMRPQVGISPAERKRMGF